MQVSTSYVRQLGFTAANLKLRLDFFRIADDDLQRLRDMRDLAAAQTDAIAEKFYEHLLSQPETRAYLDDPLLIERLKRKQIAYFLSLFEGKIDLDYVERRLRIGAVHEQLGVPPRWYIGAYAHYLSLVHDALRDRGGDVLGDLQAVEKMMHFDAALAIDAYIAANTEAEKRQQAAIRELSTPVIRIHDRVLLLPLVGTIDSHRAQHVMQSVLARIADEQARVLILDIAGVAVVDTQVADYLLKTTAAVRLLGARTILTGISPQVARTIVELGVSLSTLSTRNKLSDGLELALSMVGKRIAGDTP